MDISLNDIATGLRGDVTDFGASLPVSDIVLRGGRRRIALPSGLNVQLQDTVSAKDFVTFLTRPANLLLHLILEGQVEGRLGPRSERFGPMPGQPAQLHLSALGQPTAFRRNITAGNHVRKVSVLVPWNWLEARGVAMQSILQGQAHLRASWTATMPDVLRAEALLQRHRQTPFCQIEAEALALSMLQTMLVGLMGAEPEISRTDQERLSRIEAQALIAGGLPSSEALAESAGMSVSSMRRLFRRLRGMSVHGRLRQIRLERAGHALHAGASVASAARQAGYETPEAFATAFRLAMGMPPSEYRKGAAGLVPAPAPDADLAQD
ncbi:helix-turn-helix domain-containing protein (plasmid) [Thioclava litoralis]|uniref:Helix-turn-helix domain-containing protein n=1 Tax=Thioclava litoralis TaxID=3076557 RepID=A0ABZ1E5N9_9RHOB|nr:helix-turn-helix domain-containing protein [Thioclava sp. FTW29]